MADIECKLFLSHFFGAACLGLAAANVASHLGSDGIDVGALTAVGVFFVRMSN